MNRKCLPQYVIIVGYHVVLLVNVAILAIRS